MLKNAINLTYGPHQAALEEGNCFLSYQRHYYVQTAGPISQRIGSARGKCLIRGSGGQTSIDRRVMEGCSQSLVLSDVEPASNHAHAWRTHSCSQTGS